MRVTVFDVETTEEGYKGSPNPYYPENKLISLGINKEYLFFLASDLEDIDLKKNKKIVQDILDKTDILVVTILSLIYHGYILVDLNMMVKLFMIAEYVSHRGAKNQISLAECCLRRGLVRKATSIIDTYRGQGMTFKDIPPKDIEFYGRRDVDRTEELFYAQMQDLKKKVTVL